MVDREKVLHGLYSCGNDDGHPDRCGRTECPYRDSGAFCTHYLVHDAEELIGELLKEQEPIEPRIVDTSNSKLYQNDMFKNHYCGNSGEYLHVVNRKDLFCSQCGRKVKWDD